MSQSKPKNNWLSPVSHEAEVQDQQLQLPSYLESMPPGPKYNSFTDTITTIAIYIYKFIARTTANKFIISHFLFQQMTYCC